MPALVDARLVAHGARRLVPRGEGDASSAEFFDAFDEWEKRVWEALGKEFGVAAKEEESALSLDVKTVSSGTARAELLRQRDLAYGKVIENKILSAPGAPEKRHIGRCRAATAINIY